MAAATSRPHEDSKHLEATGDDTHQEPANTGYSAMTGGNRRRVLCVHTAEVSGSIPLAPTLKTRVPYEFPGGFESAKTNGDGSATN